MSPEIQPVRLIMVDDHPAVLRQAIQLLPERFEVVEALESGAGLRAAVREHAPDLVVLDITLPRVSGIELARQLRADRSELKIIFLTVHADPDYAIEAFEAGAAGYVIKPRLATDLVPALEAALAGKRFVSPCPTLKDLADG